MNRKSAFSGLDERDQLLGIVKVVVISNDSFAVIDDAPAFIFFKAVQQSVHTVTLDKQCESIWFYLA